MQVILIEPQPGNGALRPMLEERLAAAGGLRCIGCSFDLPVLSEEIAGALREADLVIVAGGLAPGGAARRAAADALGVSLRHSKKAASHIERLCAMRGEDPAAYQGCALLPEDGRPLLGDGLLPGCACLQDGHGLLLLDEQPDEALLAMLFSAASSAQGAVPDTSARCKSRDTKITAIVFALLITLAAVCIGLAFGTRETVQPVSSAPSAESVSSLSEFESSSEPEPSSEPGSSSEPESSSEPQSSSEPEPSSEPESLSEPESSSEPEPSSEPLPEEETVIDLAPLIPNEPASQPEPEDESGPEEESESSDEGNEQSPPEYPDAFEETLSYLSGGVVRKMNAYDLVCAIVQNETNGIFAEEALKAHAVASYTYVRYNNAQGISPSVGLKTNISNAVANAVSDVLGQTIRYNGALINAVYHSTSGGSTTSARAVWGGSLPYLESVDSEWDSQAPKFAQRYSVSANSFANGVERVYGITLDGDPSDWIVAERDAAGGYVGTVTLGGYTTSQGGSYGRGKAISGRSIREQLFGYKIRSHCFDVEYDEDDDVFVFTTYGYGHGVGMSQYGAHFMALEGYDYIDILTHYYSGVTIK